MIFVWINFIETIFKKFQIECKQYDTTNKREIDLTPLINTQQNYLAKITESLKPIEPKNSLVS